MPGLHNAILTEAELLERVAAGDEHAFTVLFDTWQPKLTHFIIQLTNSRETALEITQELFLKIWLNRTSLTQVDDLNAYLFASAKNRVLNEFKATEKERLRNRGYSQLISGESHTTEETVLLHDTRALVEKAIEALPSQQRKVYLLSREEGMTQEAIALQLGISLETVKKHMVLALRHIRTALKDHHPAVILVLTGIFPASS